MSSDPLLPVPKAGHTKALAAQPALLLTLTPLNTCELLLAPPIMFSSVRLELVRWPSWLPEDSATRLASEAAPCLNSRDCRAGNGADVRHMLSTHQA